MNQRLLIEAALVGVLVVFLGLAIMSFVKTQTWAKQYPFEITLFLTGVLTHLVCEFTGVNKWYCTNGNACL
jgi:xanthosine utilization system XapX-like protein